MSKKTRKSGKKPAKKAGKSPVRKQQLPAPALEVLHEARQCIQAGDWGDAYDRLVELNEAFPRREEILDPLVEVCLSMHDIQEVLRHIESLHKLRPGDKELTFRLGMAYLATGNQALALGMLRRAADLGDLPAQAKMILETLEFGVTSVAADLGLEEGEDALATLERARLDFSRQQPDEARRHLHRLLARQPDATAALCLLARVEFSQGHLEQALATVERVPEGGLHHAESRNLRVRYLAALGRGDEARRQALDLAESPSWELFEGWLALIHSLLLVEENRKVIETCGAAHQALDELEQDLEAFTEELEDLADEDLAEEALNGEDPDEEDLDEEDLDEPAVDPADENRALLLHLEAVATLRLGDEERARELWEHALELDPDLTLAEENLGDLDNPSGDRDAPWAFDQDYLLPQPLLTALAERLEPVLKTGRDEAIQRAARTGLRHYPAMLTLMPLALAQGGPRLRTMMLELATFASTPETLAILRDFAFSTHGSDRLRSQACRTLRAKGAMPEGPIRLWTQGQWREVDLIDIEITHEPTGEYSHSPRVEKLAEEAIELIRAGDGPGAEALLRRALEEEQDALDLNFNLANALSLQGREDEFRQIVERLHAENPDYIFAATAKAQFLLREGKSDEAAALVGPLLQRGRLHITELEAIYDMQIQLAMAAGNSRGVISLLQQWEQADPNSWGLQQWRKRFLTGARLGLEQGLGEKDS